jgi:hypothetical protein
VTRARSKTQNKFRHGFGIFQYDLQFFKTNPGYFLQKKWQDCAACAAKCVEELKDALKRQGWADKTTLNDTDKVYVAIAYNKGRANPTLGFKQGYKSDDGRYYGENIFEFLRIAQSIPVGTSTITLMAPASNAAPLPPPTPIDATLQPPLGPGTEVGVGVLAEAVDAPRTIMRTRAIAAARVAKHEKCSPAILFSPWP